MFFFRNLSYVPYSTRIRLELVFPHRWYWNWIFYFLWISEKKINEIGESFKNSTFGRYQILDGNSKIEWLFQSWSKYSSDRWWNEVILVIFLLNLKFSGIFFKEWDFWDLTQTSAGIKFPSNAELYFLHVCLPQMKTFICYLFLLSARIRFYCATSFSLFPIFNLFICFPEKINKFIFTQILRIIYIKQIY